MPASAWQPRDRLATYLPPVVAGRHPAGAVADKGRTMDCAAEDHRLCCGPWCNCKCHR